jgi:ligand-binding sensor domain-containing protein/signal transduction histidine kinase
VAFACLASSAKALDSKKAISQYISETWSAEQGFPGGPVYAFAQTPDGYLWIGTEKGLMRFDGLNFHLMQRSDSTLLPEGPVLGLAVDSEGALWIRAQGPTLLRYKDERFLDVLAALQEEEINITAMCRAEDGSILFAGHSSGIVRYSKGKFATIGGSADVPGLILSLAETPDGKVWMGLREEGLFYVKDGRFSAVTRGLPDKKVNSLLPLNSQQVWIGTDRGVVRWSGSELTKTTFPGVLDHAQVLVMTEDRDSNVWVGTSSGLIRIDPQGIAQSQKRDKQAADAVSALFEDREGNLWVGTTRGIERLRDSAFTTYSVPADLPSATSGPIHMDSEGRTWFAPTSGGLYWLKEGRIGSVREGGLGGDVVYSIDGREGELWVGRRRGGLTQIRYRGDSYTTRTYTQVQGLAQDSVYAVHQSDDGTVWAGTLKGGLSRLRGGRFTTYTKADGLASNAIDSIAEVRDGTMWFGTPNGVSVLSGGRWRVYTSRDGLPPGSANCLLSDASGVLWIGTPNGLAFINAGIAQSPREMPEPLHEEIFGIEEDKIGSLWIATTNHIVQIDRNKLLRGTVSDSDVRVFGLADGLLSTQGVKRFRSVVRGPSGRIWISTGGGLSFVDPKPVSFSSVPALVHVEGISADGRSFALGGSLRIPAPHQRITMSYAALSLAVPARVRFKYRLDDFDQGWSEPTAAREAVYTNLDSGSYRFRVLASNSDGLWNSAESTVQIDVLPAFWQTWWFRLCSVVMLIMVTLALVRLRIRKLGRELNVRFEERLSERTRIAQELHDTLLQGLLMQLHVADERLAADSAAKPLVGRVLALMDQVIEEGRNAVQGLRTSRHKFSDLAQAFSQVRAEFPVQSETEFRVIVSGTPKPLRPMIGDEVYRIGREALSNAFRHAHASDVEVEIEYAASQLRVLVRDDGSGIDPQVLQSGRDGHWGLSGMKERTEKIGAKLRVLSHAEAGTEVEVSVPGQIAFELQPKGDRRGWLARLFS